MYLEKEHLLLIGKGDNPCYLVPKMANRHGLITGATGTGKTVTLKVLAESFSEMGTPVFLADIKGDVTGMIKAGNKDEIQKRLDKLSIDKFECKTFPTRFWDVYGELGTPVRTTISEMGPDLISRLLELTDAQAGVMNIVFRVADDNGLLLIDLKDLQSMVKYVYENAKDIREEYGNVSPQSVGAIQRSLLALEDAGGDIFFGEPDLDIDDWFKLDSEGRGYINILESSKLAQSPLLYSSFLLWMLSSIYERMPEAGDLDKPKMVFFFDEAHMLFNDAPKSLINKVEQVCRLIRSKGVGVYFISQKPADIPANVLAQLGNKIQHALHAYTPAEQKAVKVAAQSFRVNPKFDTETVISELGIGEAIVSFLDEEGVPSMVERAYILPPQSSMKVADEDSLKRAIEDSPFYYKYTNVVDRESAYEILTAESKRAEEEAKKKAEEDAELKAMRDREKAEEVARKQREKEERDKERAEASARREEERLRREKERERAQQNKMLKKTVNTVTNTIGREVGKSISRGILGGIKNMFK